MQEIFMVSDLDERTPLDKARCTVYIDGFNWYYGIFAHKPEWKWINVQSFFEELRLDDDIVAIKFFTSLVSPGLTICEARDRQKRLLKAFGTLAKVKIIYGNFQSRRTRCLATCREEYQAPEEKKTDVNIAISILDDVIKKKTDTVVLVSGDSDIQPAIQWVVQNFPDIKVSVYVPTLEEQRSERRSDFYRQIRVSCKFLPLDRIPYHQLPSKLLLSTGGYVERPVSWK
jgi:6-hydroxy-3-succinoylpyridine 3-monooxygenase